MSSRLVEPVTAVVPVRNGSPLLAECLRSLWASGVEAVIVVDGLSTDGSRELARENGAEVLSDEGRGLPYARFLGIQTAETKLVWLVDCDVVVASDTLARLVEEFRQGGYAALQAGLVSEGGPGYWGRALAEHHRGGRSRYWFGLVATLVNRDLLLATGYDAGFSSGEDVELRWRLRDRGLRAGVSRDVLVRHRFAGDDFDFARDQFLMDGKGLGLMLRNRGLRAAPLGLLPLAAGARGIGLSLSRLKPGWVVYYLAFIWFNYLGIARGLRE